jgi:uncharacterized protein
VKPPWGIVGEDLLGIHLCRRGAACVVAFPAKFGGMECRVGCGACCIAPSISSPIPGMPQGKPAGVPCVQLLADFRCALFGRPERPPVCVTLRPSMEMCGRDRRAALDGLTALEEATSPGNAICRRRPR